MPDHGIAPRRIPFGAEGLAWNKTHCAERKGRKAAHGVIGPVHDELHALSNRHEFADDQLIAHKIKVIAHAAGDKMLRSAGIVVIAEIPDLDFRVVDDRLR